MSIGTGWYVALGTLLVGAIWKSQRPGEMTEERDRIYRECLSGRVPAEKMRDIMRAFEKARCFPQARMLQLRIELKELPPEIKEVRTASFKRAMASKNRDGVLRVADAFEAQGATTSAAKLRAHAERLPKATEAEPIVTPPPPESEPPPETEGVSDNRQTAEVITNGTSHHVAVHETPAIVN